MVAAAVAVAVHGEQDSRLDLREPVDDALHAEVGRAARPDGAEARAGVERDDRLDDVGEVRDDPVAGPDARGAERRRGPPCRLFELSPGRLAEWTELRGVPDGDRVGLPVAIRVRRVVEPCPREPARPRHRARVDDAAVGLRRAHAEEVPDRAPERLELGHGPAPEVVVALRANAAGVREPARVVRDRGALDPGRVGLPEDRRRLTHGEEPTCAPRSERERPGAPRRARPESRISRPERRSSPAGPSGPAPARTRPSHPREGT